MSKAQNVDDAVFEYMKQQNRPYSANDIHLNLHKTHGKTAVVKSLESLAAEKKLLEKVYGKAKIYVVHQSLFPEVGEAELGKLDVDIKAIQSQIATSVSQTSLANKELQALLAQPTTKEAIAELAILKEEEMKVAAVLQKLQKPGKKVLDPAEKKKLVKTRDEMSLQLRKRKRMTKDLIGAVLEGYPKSKKQFIEDVGLEILPGDGI